jgi:hypothetical protein
MVQYKKSLAFGVWCLVELSSHVFFLHERMIISIPKYHFYPEVSGQAILYFTPRFRGGLFNILHFFLRHKDSKAQRNTKAFSFPK